MHVNSRIFRVVPNGYKTGKSPKRHSGMFLAGIQGPESLPDPGQMPAGVTMRVGSWSPMYSKVKSNSLKLTRMGVRRGDVIGPFIRHPVKGEWH